MTRISLRFFALLTLTFWGCADVHDPSKSQISDNANIQQNENPEEIANVGNAPPPIAPVVTPPPPVAPPVILPPAPLPVPVPVPAIPGLIGLAPSFDGGFDHHDHHDDHDDRLTCGESDAPQCGGFCPSGQRCEDVRGNCACLTPSLSLVKTANVSTLPAAGNVITYTFTVHNGPVPLNDVTIDDSVFSGLGNLSPLNCNLGALPVNLAANQDLICTANYTVQAGDIAVGGIANGAQATGFSGRIEVCDSAVLVIPAPPPSTLSLLKVVFNDNGGTALPAGFDLTLTGADGTHNTGINYASGASIVVEAGVSYTLSETPPEGYTLTGIVCVDDATALNVPNPFTPALGQSVTCTFTNNDNPPTLSLLKVVNNTNGGTALPAAFALTLTGADGINNAGVNYASGASIVLEAGVSYTLSKTPPAGYTLTGIVCVDDATALDVPNPFTPFLGQSVTCTLTNNDNSGF